MYSSLDTSATSLSESVKGVHSSTNLFSTCNLPVLGHRQILSVSTLPLLLVSCLLFQLYLNLFLVLH